MRGVSLIILMCAALCSRGNIRLPAVIASNMVLQQRDSVKIWGWADPHEKITLTPSWDKKTYETTGSRDARWEINIATPAAGGPHTITLKGKNTIVLTNVMVGEVWICSGQSNMEMCGQWGLQDIKAELPTAHLQNVRFFHIPKTTAPYPQENCEGQWTACDSATLPSFSAVAYFFGKRLSKELNVPVGLIAASWGGTAAEIWTPGGIVHKDPVLAQAAKKIEPSGMCPYEPGYAFNAMIAPVTHYAIAGVIWYQGENNTGAASTYRRLFTAMIDSWRDAWQRDLPFYFVQIAPFVYRLKNTGALLREAQLQSATHHKTGMVVVTDLVADTHNVHPANKHDVGWRLANMALVNTYHKQGIPFQSPVFRNMDIQGKKAVVTFTGDKGLKIKGPVATEWLMAGPDRIFHPATISIRGQQVTVSSPMVKAPVAVRYGFRDAAMGNLFSGEGLPVSPFRTDSWDVAIK
ncbi:sialate O-acetylesterase [Chitinophaga lutea]|uniref:Sialate O-acetylesterase n=1 Tax=Chitinophaga lutea TaxID=2488634 RepID=A0A3N4PNM9_9BACT|nr:sialate O-acetylesterase [Chitinophaga lutea]RPE09208.1 sialate O-acetylesterase [Chitinophaga lutea]